MTAEQKMALAQVVLTVRDVAAFAAGKTPDTENGENFAECWAWINDTTNPGDYPFDKVCEVVGVDPDFLRVRLAKLLDCPDDAETLLAEIKQVRKTTVNDHFGRHITNDHYDKMRLREAA